MSKYLKNTKSGVLFVGGLKFLGGEVKELSTNLFESLDNQGYLSPNFQSGYLIEVNSMGQRISDIDPEEKKAEAEEHALKKQEEIKKKVEQPLQGIDGVGVADEQALKDLGPGANGSGSEVL